MNDLHASPNSLTNTQGLKTTPPPPKNEIVIFFLLNMELWLYRTFCLTEKVNCFVYTPSLYSFKPSWNRLYIVHIGKQYIVLQIIQRKLPLLC